MELVKKIQKRFTDFSEQEINELYCFLEKNYNEWIKVKYPNYKSFEELSRDEDINVISYFSEGSLIATSIFDIEENMIIAIAVASQYRKKGLFTSIFRETEQAIGEDNDIVIGNSDTSIGIYIPEPAKDYEWLKVFLEKRNYEESEDDLPLYKVQYNIDGSKIDQSYSTQAYDYKQLKDFINENSARVPALMLKCIERGIMDSDFDTCYICLDNAKNEPVGFMFIKDNLIINNPAPHFLTMNIESIKKNMYYKASLDIKEKLGKDLAESGVDIQSMNRHIPCIKIGTYYSYYRSQK